MLPCKHQQQLSLIRKKVVASKCRFANFLLLLLTYTSDYYFITEALNCSKNRNDVTEFKSINYQIHLSKF